MKISNIIILDTRSQGDFLVLLVFIIHFLAYFLPNVYSDMLSNIVCMGF